MKFYVFAIGYEQRRVVKVKAASYEEAKLLALEKLDLEAEAEGLEGPVMWDIIIKEIIG